MTGWECPRCHVCWAPSVTCCSACDPRQERLSAGHGLIGALGLAGQYPNQELAFDPEVQIKLRAEMEAAKRAEIQRLGRLVQGTQAGKI